jgi:hypothetical protein
MKNVNGHCPYCIKNHTENGSSSSMHVAPAARIAALRFLVLIRDGDDMTKANVKAPRLVALFLLANLLFNYPLLALFNRPASVFGVPLLFAYVFVAWLMLIVLLALIAERK